MSGGKIPDTRHTRIEPSIWTAISTSDRIRALTAFAAGALLGSTVALDGLYPLQDWGVWAAAACALLALAVVATPLPLGRPAGAAAGALALLCGWAYLSVGWAESADRALATSGRIAFAAAAFLLGLALHSRRSNAPSDALAAGFCAAVGAVALYLVGVMLAGDGARLLAGGRLEDPLGYANGQAAYLVAAAWFPLALAAATPRRSLGAAAVAAASLLISLLVLTQSRAGVLALLLALGLVLIPREPRAGRLAAAASACGGTLAATPLLLAVFPDGGDAELRLAAVAALAGALLAAGLWLLFPRLVPVLRVRALRGRAGAAVAALAVAAIFALVLFAAFEGGGGAPVAEDAGEAGSRFAATGESRSDYWRVALSQFADHPVRGAGAGNFANTWFAERESDENLTQPHSLELQALAELGVVGLLLVACFLVAAGAAAAMSGLPARGSPGQLAAAAACAAFLAQTSVDWLHLFPGLTAFMMLGSAGLAASASEAWPRERRTALAVRAVAVAAAALVGFSVVRLTLADERAEDARALVASDPEASLREARDGLELNDESLSLRFAEAAALARLGRYEDSRDALLEATAREPNNHVPWTLLGDLATRRGDDPLALRAYTRASELNPRDDELRKLAASARH